ncbi:MAG: CRISPR-associated endonuclease Cas1 [Leptolyngbya sp. SIO3F4]|nr:CRISPR-associated endonuclease Cas1 [Leptolyngbya sp. SIO3F4]
MSTIYLTHQGSKVTKQQGKFSFQRPEQSPLAVPIREINRMVVFGNVHLTMSVIATCLQTEIPVVFLSQAGKYKGHLWSAICEDLTAEIAQFAHWKKAEFQRTMARSIVWGKLENSRQLLLRLNRKRKLHNVAEAIAGISADMADLDSVDDLDQLRGYEGVAAARYFPALGQLITVEEFQFNQRSRRPPKDATNAMLSFGYTLLHNNVLSLILAEGLNPYLGNLHRSDRKETHLAFDLIEEFRSPVVDTLVITLINRGVIKPDEFGPSPDGEGIYLSDDARRRFIREFEKRMSTETAHPMVKKPVIYRRAIQLQVQRYKKCLLDGVAYEPFLRAV